MNKFLTITFSVLISISGLGQSSINDHPTLPCESMKSDLPANYNTKNRSNSFWSEDFNGGLTTANGTWITTGIWKHSYSTTNGAYSGGTNPFTSTTSSNGFMLFDSDSANTDFSTMTMVTSPIGYTGELISPVIDLSGQPSALLTLEQDFRFCCSNSHTMQLSVSTDSGTTWGNPYDLSFGLAVNTAYSSSNSGYYSFVNISSEAANQSNVKLKFTWNDPGLANSHYYWALDDIGIELLPDNDIKNESSWIYGQSTNFAEYGRTPLSQMDPNWVVGCQVSNIGFLDQDSVTLDVDFGSFSTSAIYDENNDGNPDILSADSTKIIQIDISPSLSSGIYQGTFTLTSDGDQSGGITFTNNTQLRNFEITNDIYSLDGIDNHPSGLEFLGSLGTNSFTDAPDGLVCATYYPVKQEEILNSVRVLITNSTVAQSEVILYILDSLSFTSGLFSNSIYTSDLYTVTAMDVSLGYIDIPVTNNIGWDPITNTSTWENVTLGIGGYYAAIELYSSGNTYDIRIIDDRTVDQPFWSSAIWFPGDQAYTNGNAFAIRMNFGASVGINENVTNNVSIYPNPTSHVLNISTNSNDLSELIIKDITGKIVFNQNFNTNITVNTENYAKGIYLIDVKNNHGTVSKKITIQ
ncbi:MAG: T9SS type A sorting domain-containing protein [Parvicellaceae bacterium]